jgi:phage-related protein
MTILGHSEIFIIKQEDDVRKKYEGVFKYICSEQRIPSKFLKHIKGEEGLYEIRVDTDKGYYRTFCCFDSDNVIVLLNSFHKKSNKTPRKEIVKAKLIKTAYYSNK